MERLLGAERAAGSHVSPSLRTGRNRGLNLVRYADDFVVTAPTREVLEDHVVPRLTEFLASRGLELSAAKTRIVQIDAGFDFLGFNIRRFPNGKLLVRPQPEKVAEHRRALSAFFKDNRQLPTAEVIKTLSPVIRGWCNYYRYAVAKRTFSALDDQVWRITYKWAKRRHPIKNRHWVVNHYYGVDQGRGWVLTDGRSQLPRHNAPRVSRFVKVKGKVSPFDPSQRGYWEERRQRRLVREAGRFDRVHPLHQQAGPGAARKTGLRPGLCQVGTSSSSATPTSWCAATPPPETPPGISSTAGAARGGRRGRSRQRWRMLEPYAGRPARTVLRGPGGQQCPPGYPTLPSNILLLWINDSADNDTQRCLAGAVSTINGPASEPNAEGLCGHDALAFGQQFRDNPQAEGEAQIEPDRVLDDGFGSVAGGRVYVGREQARGDARGHPATLDSPAHIQNACARGGVAAFGPAADYQDLGEIALQHRLHATGCRRAQHDPRDHRADRLHGLGSRRRGGQHRLQLLDLPTIDQGRLGCSASSSLARARTWSRFCILSMMQKRLILPYEGCVPIEVF